MPAPIDALLLSLHRLGRPLLSRRVHSRLSTHRRDEEVAANGEGDLSAARAVFRLPCCSTPPYSTGAHVLAAQTRCRATGMFRIIPTDYRSLNVAHVLLYDRSTECLSMATAGL